MSAEVWRPAPGLPGYMVSNLGRVRSHRRRRVPLVMTPRPDRSGYLKLAFRCGGKQPSRLVHHLVAEAFHGPRPDGRVVRHLNGEPFDNRAENLRWGTQSQNLRDAVSHGTHPMARKTHCPQGHVYDEENTKTYRGMRYCRICRRAWNLAYKRRVRAGAAA